MTSQIALDKATNDIIKDPAGGILRVEEGRYTVQLVQNKLQTLLGEWVLDPTVGWLNYEDFTKNPDLFGIEMRARTEILETKGVSTIDSMELVLESRVLTLSFTATTIYGGISLTVPWSL